MSVHLWYGEDDFRIKESLSNAQHQVGMPDLWEANTINLNGPGLTPNNLIQTCSMVPFLAEKRMTIVEGLLSLFEPIGRRGQQRDSPGKSQDVGPWKDLPHSLKLLPSTTILIFLDRRLSSNNPLLKIVSSMAEVREFPILKGEDLRNWVLKRLTATDGKIVPGALRLICDLVGGNLWAMQGELDKLQLYTHGRSIEESDVHLLVSSAREANVFSMVDAVLDGKSGVAIKGMHELMESGASAQYIISMIGRQLRLTLLAKEMFQKKVPQEHWSARLGLAGFALNKTRDQAKRHNDNRLLSLYRRLLRLDLEIKTGELDEILAMEILVSEVSRLQV